ncbi:MAG: TldD/PmbA family protein [Leptospira sp.]|nr:TldD/PmbA family protein [Leptospira sp.]
MRKEELQKKCDETGAKTAELIAKAKRSGTKEVEIFSSFYSSTEISLEKNDINSSNASEETTYGIRVIENNCEGFATTNDAESIYESILEAKALAIAQKTPDPAMELPVKAELKKVEGLYSDEMDSLSFEDILELVKESLETKKNRYPKVNIDSGSFSFYKGFKFISSSRGVHAGEIEAGISAGYMGMAVDGDDIGSFDHEGCFSRSLSGFRKEQNENFSEFLEKCMSALKARTIDGFRGNILIPPESVFSFLGDLLGSLSGSSIRRGRSKFGNKMNSSVASDLLSINENPHIPGFGGTTSFDREGMPTLPKDIIKHGVIRSFFYNHYEAKKAGLKSSLGNALGGASSSPSCGPRQLQVEPGKSALADMLNCKEKTILIGRFSGSSDMSSGEFSGVVKGGFFLQNQEKFPIKEISISGNMYDALNHITDISREQKLLYNSSRIPYIKIEGLDITGSDEKK